MKFSVDLFLDIFAAIQHVEQTVKGSANKKQKAIEIIAASASIAGKVSPKVEAGIGQIIDATVAIHNGIEAAK